MNRPKLLDLYCCEGGASRGYELAGFNVTGVDINPQPNYPYPFIQADALEYLAEHGDEYDYIHASPPCPKFSAMLSIRKDGAEIRDSHPDLLTPTRAALEALGKPYIIENVTGAANYMAANVTLCGTMFGRPFIRHRLFESNRPMIAPCECKHNGTVDGGEYMGIYSMGGAMKRPDGQRRAGSRNTDDWRAALQVPWLSRYGCTQAIPACYTEWLGRQLIQPIQDYLVTAEKKRTEPMGNINATDMETALTDYFAAEDAVNLYKITTPVKEFSLTKMRDLAAEMERTRKIARQSARIATKQDLPLDWRPGAGDRQWYEKEKAKRLERLGRGGAR